MTFLPEMGPPPTAALDDDALDWWLDLAPGLPWHLASTKDHSYVVRDKHLADPDFTRAVQVIRTYGTPGQFWGRTLLYLHDPHSPTKWWTMTGTISQQGVINTTDDEATYGPQVGPATANPAPDPVAVLYDHLATVYDQRYDGTHCPDCEQENETIRRLITRYFGAYAPTTLDVGCGTGLLLDLGITAPALYTGVDPSQGMLNELVRKHPKWGKLWPARMEDIDHNFAARPFELVVSLFGSASYLPPEVITTLPALSSDMTVLMHYREGYLPDYWSTQPVQPPHVDSSREAARGLGGRRFMLNNFEVTVLHG